VTVCVDESRNNNVPFRIDGFRTLDRFLRDGGDLAVLDTDIANSVEPALRVHDSAVQDHQIVVTREGGNDCEPAEQGESDPEHP
jgi:hypothetical protein